MWKVLPCPYRQRASGILILKPANSEGEQLPVEGSFYAAVAPVRWVEPLSAEEFSYAAFALFQRLDPLSYRGVLRFEHSTHLF